MLLKAVSNLEKNLYSRASRARFFNFFEKSESFNDPSKKKIRKSKLSNYIVPGLVLASWVLIFKVWWGAEEICRKQYEAMNQRDASAYRTVFENKERIKNEVPEEYRSEYIEKQKRRMSAILKQKKDAENAGLLIKG